MYCVWPLYLAGSWVGSTAAQRRWIIGRLRYIGRTLGVQQATVFAERLAEATPSLPEGMVDTPWQDEADGYSNAVSDDDHEHEHDDDDDDDDDDEDKDDIEVDDGIHYEHDLEEPNDDSDPWRSYLGIVGKFGLFPGSRRVRE